MDALAKPILYTCKHCTLTAAVPIVGPIANPQYKGEGRCFNGHACKLRAKKVTESMRAGAAARAHARNVKPKETTPDA